MKNEAIRFGPEIKKGNLIKSQAVKKSLYKVIWSCKKHSIKVREIG
jgi:hypothetical protein